LKSVPTEQTNIVKKLMPESQERRAVSDRQRSRSGNVELVAHRLIAGQSFNQQQTNLIVSCEGQQNFALQQHWSSLTLISRSSILKNPFSGASRYRRAD
jgi:hypothetical protein